MSRNLQYQFYNAIMENFGGGGKDKHALKQSEEKMQNVYSFKEMKSLTSVSSDFGKFMKENFKDIKLVQDIKADHIQKFLENKASACRQNTLENYVSRFNKLQVIVNKTYHCEVKWKDSIYAPQSFLGNEKLRDIAMSKEDMKKIDAVIADSKSEGKNGIFLAKNYGLRAEECCTIQVRNVDLDNHELHVLGKGGRWRTLDIKPEDKNKFEEILKGKTDKDRLCSLQERSLQKFLERAEAKAGIREKYKNKNTGMHAIRKMYATENYKEYIKKGYSHKEAWGKVLEQLGHGRDRAELFRTYVILK